MGANVTIIEAVEECVGLHICAELWVVGACVGVSTCMCVQWLLCTTAVILLYLMLLGWNFIRPCCTS